MIQEVNESQEYISRSGYRFKVLHKAKHAQDCSIPMIVYTNLEPTFDAPIGKVWVVSESIFLSRMSELD